ncbi:MAG: phage tail protein [Lachnospiraceae bacterium]|nr:phage tail protein [Lachnospiraceae bacterium]MDE7201916.1 phage tail protein [Lachnospiraceae bacterium]
MYQFDDVGSTYFSLPPNLQNTGNACFAYAFDRQIKRLHMLAKKLTVWSDLDHADPKYYDHIAISIRAPYYKSEYSEKQKLKLIKATLESRTYAGTIKAVEDLLSHSILHAKFVPWYEYGGEPYHFKIETSDAPEEESRTLFANMLQRVKAARSIIDGVEIDHDPVRNIVYIGAGISHQRIVHICNREKLEYRFRGAVYTGCTAVIKKQIVIKGGK